MAEVCSKHPYGSLIKASIASNKLAKLVLNTLASNLTDPSCRVAGRVVEKLTESGISVCASCVPIKPPCDSSLGNPRGTTEEN